MGGSSTGSKSTSATSESPLSQEQLKILQNRENIFNSYFWPTYQTALENSMSMDSDQSKAQLSSASNQINASYNAAEKQTNQRLAQQGLLGDQSGVQAALNAKNNRARASALSEAYYNTLSNNNSNVTNLLGIGSDLMTKPTSSSQYYTTTTSKSDGSSWNIF